MLISDLFYDLFGQISNLAFRPLLRLHQFGCQCLYFRIFQSYKLPKWANNESEHTKKNGNATKKSVSLFCTLVGWQKQNKTHQRGRDSRIHSTLRSPIAVISPHDQHLTTAPGCSACNRAKRFGTKRRPGAVSAFAATAFPFHHNCTPKRRRAQCGGSALTITARVSCVCPQTAERRRQGASPLSRLPRAPGAFRANRNAQAQALAGHCSHNY